MLKKKTLSAVILGIIFLATALLSSSPVVAMGTSYYVASNGNDTNPGTELAPWKTIQKAANTLQPGDTVFIKAGTYNEKVTVNVSGTAAGGYITFRNYGTDRVILSGTGKVGDDMFLIKDKNYIKVIGLEICNNNSTSTKEFPKGIYVTGSGKYIELRNNLVHDITCPGKRCGAHGIAVYGTSSTASINNIIIDNNEIRNCKLGWSESMVLNGNVEDFQVTNNIVHDNDNIGIDFIGYEGTCPVQSLDRARNGVCRGNLVYNIDSLLNPAYNSDRGADGIYVDGGTSIIIERNISHHNNIGIELASEHSGLSTSYITVRDNLIYNSHIMGIAMGGYDTKRGSSIGNIILNNTLYNNDTDKAGFGEIVLQYDIQNNTIKNNVLYANSQNIFISNYFTLNTGNVLDNNLYYSTDAANAIFIWKKVSYIGFSAYKQAIGNDANSIFTDPLFVNANSLDFHLKSASPAINAGDPSFVPASGETDLDGNPRLLGGHVDCGAYEAQ